MKGILKGFRYFTQLFDEQEKEPQMQIGLPTDVKHVAHIGWDGPSSNAKTPSWMNDIGGLESSGEPKDSTKDAKKPGNKSSSEDVNQTGRELPDSQTTTTEKPKHRTRRKSSSSTGTGSPISSPTKKSSSDAPKLPRRHRNHNNTNDSPGRDSPGRIPKRLQNSNLGSDSPSRDQPAIPKHSRHRRSKGGSSGGESTKSSRSKDRNNVATGTPI